MALYMENAFMITTLSPNISGSSQACTLKDLFGLSILPLVTETLSSRFIFTNLSRNSWVFSHVASLTGSRFHWTKLSSINLDPHFTQRVSNITSDSISKSPSSAIGGKSVLATIISPNFFLEETYGKLGEYESRGGGAWVYRQRFQFFPQLDMAHKICLQAFDRLFWT